MSSVKVRDILDSMARQMGEVYADAAEGKAVVELLLMHHLNTTRFGLYQTGRVIESDALRREIEKDFARLHANEPVQYVIGKAWFCDMELQVAPGVLIPRPETEELVKWVVENLSNGTKKRQVVDLGTGSGCIALAIKKKCPETEVWGVDFSAEALAVATANAEAQKLDVNWVLGDLTDPDFFPGCTERLIVTCNPPYIPESERRSMAARVLDYEPASALFVPDEDPLLYYRMVIGKFASRADEFFFEIHAPIWEKYKSLVLPEQAEISFRNDSHGRTRLMHVSIVNER